MEAILKSRCCICRLPLMQCICNALPKISVATRVVVLMQQAEWNVSSNTGHFISKILTNSSTHIRGRYDKQKLVIPPPQHVASALCLFPSVEAVELNTSLVQTLSAPATLYVIDGNWGQAARMVRKLNLPYRHVKLPQGLSSDYKVRVAHREDGVCTMEAIARSLGILENQEVQLQIETFFYLLINKILWMRGKHE